MEYANSAPSPKRDRVCDLLPRSPMLRAEPGPEKRYPRLRPEADLQTCRRRERSERREPSEPQLPHCFGTLAFPRAVLFLGLASPIRCSPRPAAIASARRVSLRTRRVGTPNWRTISSDDGKSALISTGGAHEFVSWFHRHHRRYTERPIQRISAYRNAFRMSQPNEPSSIR